LVQDKDYTATTTTTDGDATTTTVREYDLGILNDKGINVDAIRRQGWDYTKPGSELLRQELDVIEWLKKEELACPFQFESAYSCLQSSSSSDGSMGVVDSNAYSDNGTTGFEVVGGDHDRGELLPFTNVTSHFVNTLDYIFFERQKFALQERLFVPTSFRQMNPEAIHNGHLLPSDVWPSDHVAIGARLLLVSEEEPDQQRAAVSEKNEIITIENDDTPIASSGSSGQWNDMIAGAVTPVPPLPQSDADAHLPSRAHPLYHNRRGPPPPPQQVLTESHRKIESMTVQDDAVNGINMFCAPIAASGQANGTSDNIANTSVPPLPPPPSAEIPPPILPRSHGSRCDCGCIPPILSMFEMAELRKQYRKQKELEKKQQQQ
jgi:hypothetical protein